MTAYVVMVAETVVHAINVEAIDGDDALAQVAASLNFEPVANLSFTRASVGEKLIRADPRNSALFAIKGGRS